MITSTVTRLVRRRVNAGRRRLEVKVKSKRARAEDNMAGGRWSHNRLLSDQHPIQADWTLSFKLVRTQ